MEGYLDISEEVRRALEEGHPVVALESTIISHGMPYPQNFETALKAEKIIRDKGCIPATTAIINGRMKAGLSEEEIEYLGRTKGIVKTSRRDFPYILSHKMDGATTVAATMIIAEAAGIKIFATGGIGGVHRGAEKTFDISADLEELHSTDVAVICAGTKSILDLGLTLEYLETRGVPVLGYRTEYLPAFYTRKSDFKVDYKMESPEETAELLKAKWGAGLKGGVVIANPVPEEYSMDEKLIKETIGSAIEEAEKEGIKGKEATPFLLSKIKELTEGKSLEANIELVYNNAALAADIAKAYSELK